MACWSADVQFLFEGYVLDPARQELTRDSEVIAVGPKVFDLLAHLVRNRERVVSKDDLLDAVWSGRIVSESTLTSHINAVRKAIGDSGEGQRPKLGSSLLIVDPSGAASDEHKGLRCKSQCFVSPALPSA